MTDYRHTPSYIAEEVLLELNQATQKFGPFKSAMEGLAIIEEEVDEFKHEVRHGSLEKAREEVIQVAAMAIRFIKDVCP